MSQPNTPWDLDVRVRERNLKKGTLDAKAVDKHLKDLPDVAAQATTISAEQPGFGAADESDED